MGARPPPTLPPHPHHQHQHTHSFRHTHSARLIHTRPSLPEWQASPRRREWACLLRKLHRAGTRRGSTALSPSRSAGRSNGLSNSPGRNSGSTGSLEQAPLLCRSSKHCRRTLAHIPRPVGQRRGQISSRFVCVGGVSSASHLLQCFLSSQPPSWPPTDPCPTTYGQWAKALVIILRHEEGGGGGKRG